MKSLRSYLLGKTSSNSMMKDVLLDPNNKIGIIMLERLVNMPPHVVPPLLRILDEEMQAAV